MVPPLRPLRGFRLFCRKSLTCAVLAAALGAASAQWLVCWFVGDGVVGDTTDDKGVRQLKQGQVIAQLGAPADSIYIVEDGQVSGCALREWVCPLRATRRHALPPLPCAACAAPSTRAT